MVEVESWEQTLADLAGARAAVLKRQAFLLCGDDNQADDLVQDALVRAFARPPRIPRAGAAEAYVRMIMVNLFIDGTRRRTRWLRAMPLLRTVGTTPDPADQVSDRADMLTALRSLSPRQRACMVLRYYERSSWRPRPWQGRRASVRATWPGGSAGTGAGGAGGLVSSGRRPSRLSRQ